MCGGYVGMGDVAGQHSEGGTLLNVGGGEATKKKVLPQDEKRKEIKKRKPYLTFLEKRENTIDR